MCNSWWGWGWAEFNAPPDTVSRDQESRIQHCTVSLSSNNFEQVAFSDEPWKKLLYNLPLQPKHIAALACTSSHNLNVQLYNFTAKFDSKVWKLVYLRVTRWRNSLTCRFFWLTWWTVVQLNVQVFSSEWGGWLYDVFFRSSGQSAVVKELL